MLLGDAAGTLNFPKIKGIHQALRSGMLAAEHIVATGSTAGFDVRWRQSAGGRELHRVRNIKPGFKRGLWFGLANGAFETLTGGAAPWTLQNSSNQGAAATGSIRFTGSPLAARARCRHATGWHPCISPRPATTRRKPVHLRVADTHLCATRLHGGVRQSLHAILSGERV